MATAAMTDFEEQIEAVRNEAFAVGYVTAMKEVKELTARAARDGGETVVPSRNGPGQRRRSNSYAEGCTNIGTGTRWPQPPHK